MNNWKLPTLLLLVAVTGFAFAQDEPEPMTTTAPATTNSPTPAAQPAIDFALMDQDGKTVRLSDFAGKIIVLEWVNPDCPFVKRHYQAGTMKTLAATYAPKGVVWLAINSTKTHTPEMNKKFQTDQDLPYPVLADQAGRVGRAYGARTTPDMRIIDATGKIAYSGAIDDDPTGSTDAPVNYVAAALDELLNGQAVSTPKTKPYGCSVKYAPAGPQAPAFTLKNQDGKVVSLSDYAGRIVVLEWVNPDCPFVKRHYKAGTMKTLAERFGPRGVVWLAVNSTHYFDVAKNKEFQDAQALSYAVLDDHDGATGHAYGAKTTPEMRIIDIDGTVAYSGAIDDNPRGNNDDVTNYVAVALEELLAGKPVTTPQTKPYGCTVKYAK